MIAGTVVLADTLLQFQANEETGEITYTVCDAMTGESETLTVDGNKFMTALGIALSYDGGVERSKTEWLHAEKIQPASKKLRFIP